MADTDVAMPIRVKVYCVIACGTSEVRSVSGAIQSSYRVRTEFVQSSYRVRTPVPISADRFGLSMRAFESKRAFNADVQET